MIFRPAGLSNGVYKRELIYDPLRARLATPLDNHQSSFILVRRNLKPISSMHIIERDLEKREHLSYWHV